MVVGDTITLRHPIRTDTASFSLVETEFIVSAIHANPIRTFAFIDLDAAGQFGLEGAANVIQAYPTDDATRSEVQRAVFAQPGVTSSQPVARISEAIDEALDQFLSFLFVTAGAVLILALADRLQRHPDHRRRAAPRTCHHAAFGLPVRTVIGVVVKESVITGILATRIGIGSGVIFLNWMLTSLATTTLPDVGIDPTCPRAPSQSPRSSASSPLLPRRSFSPAASDT